MALTEHLFQVCHKVNCAAIIMDLIFFLCVEESRAIKTKLRQAVEVATPVVAAVVPTKPTPADDDDDGKFKVFLKNNLL